MPIRRSTKLPLLVAGAVLIWACAKGTDIPDTEIVYVSLQPAGAADAGPDAEAPEPSTPPVEP